MTPPHAHLPLKTHRVDCCRYVEWGCGPCGIADAISTSSYLSSSVCQCLSISYLCSLCHLFISPCPFLCISLSGSSSPFHQIEADSCHQAYFRHWHTHIYTSACSISSLFTLSLRSSPCLVISPSFCFDSIYLLASVQLGKPSEAFTG